MMDFVFLAVTIVLFGLSIAYARRCGRI